MRSDFDLCLRVTIDRHHDAGAGVLSYDLASFYAESGDKDKAFPTINQSIDNQDYFAVFLKVDPILNPLHDDPRYQEALKKLGLVGS